MKPKYPLNSPLPPSLRFYGQASSWGVFGHVGLNQLYRVHLWDGHGTYIGTSGVPMYVLFMCVPYLQLVMELQIVPIQQPSPKPDSKAFALICKPRAALNIVS